VIVGHVDTESARVRALAGGHGRAAAGKLDAVRLRCEAHGQAVRVDSARRARGRSGSGDPIDTARCFGRARRATTSHRTRPGNSSPQENDLRGGAGRGGRARHRAKGVRARETAGARANLAMIGIPSRCRVVNKMDSWLRPRAFEGSRSEIPRVPREHRRVRRAVHPHAAIEARTGVARATRSPWYRGDAARGADG